MGQTEGNEILKDFFTYQLTLQNINPQSSATGNILVQADSDFVVQKLTSTAFTSAENSLTYEENPQISISITDSGSGRNLQSSNVPVPSLFGNGQLPFILPTPKLFSARTTITVNVANFSSDVTIGELGLSFIGYKIFRSGASI